MSRTVFVSGATGVLGRRVVPALVAAGHTVTANVRNDAARIAAEAAGARTDTIDLFNSDDTARLADTHDAVVHIATSIPTGASAGRRSAWAMNDRLRSHAASNLAAAMAAAGGSYVGESTTFPYSDGGARWIDEQQSRSYFWGDQSCVEAEAASTSVIHAGGGGVCLRFAMFFADDSAHVQLIRSLAQRGIFGLPGLSDAHMSWIHIDDAASAVVAALAATPGIYNVAEPDPVTRREHAAALATAVRRRRLRRVPGPFMRLGGQGIKSLALAHRVSSRALADDTGWQATRSVVDCWDA